MVFFYFRGMQEIVVCGKFINFAPKTTIFQPREEQNRYKLQPVSLPTGFIAVAYLSVLSHRSHYVYVPQYLILRGIPTVRM